MKIGRLFVFALFVIQGGLNSAGSLNQNSPHPERGLYVSPNDIPVALRSQYLSLNSGFEQEGAKWRDGLIEHRKVVEVFPNSTRFYSEEVVALTSNYINVAGASSVTISETNSFSSTHTITTSIDISVAGETALGVGASVYGVNLSASTASQAAVSFGYSVSYSSTYSSSSGTSVTYYLDDIPNVPANCSIATCVVADYFECSARIKEEEYWWHGTYTTKQWENFLARFYTFQYVTYCFSDGSVGYSPNRPY